MPRTARAPQFSADALVRARTAAHFTREQLAVAAGVPYESLRRYERGTSCPTYNIACKLAHALSVRLDIFAAEPRP